MKTIFKMTLEELKEFAKNELTRKSTCDHYPLIEETELVITDEKEEESPITKLTSSTEKSCTFSDRVVDELIEEVRRGIDKIDRLQALLNQYTIFPGEGYRILGPTETIQEGDEYLYSSLPVEWSPTNKCTNAVTGPLSDNIYRRPIKI